MIFYLIMAILTAIIIVTLQLAFNKKQRKQFEGPELVMFPMFGGICWPLTLTICILFMLYKFFLKDIHEKVITWISERL